MFDIHKREYKDPLLGLKYVADPDRLVTLQRVAGLAHRPGAAFKMTVGEAVIPFEVTGDMLTDPETGQEFILRRFESFGASPTAKLLGQIEPYEFPDKETRARFLLLAAEALIVFGWSYDGFSQDEGFIRVDVGGRTLTLRDIAHP
ncbi:hypothetical protein D7Z96_00415 [Pseudarthrobacter phenanthrenivorans]|uniref:Uncharacterized protein n=1 Tax=Pseudarthrobacter phenanthrenivorans TaxID=361575 RepID=A0A3B0G5W7_PSEPS|nr:hypothetical protein [Pseudarthrobacter phenanthrenivorans]RKO27438.1 hypothetical protein D7Z96_00415 [Pseudarthrobacter phenanthrenivorans]TPV53380.1 hypothetical protein FJ661_01980 [Pseudarthrobacter phenanthrenivorans]